jgi:Ser/Thr protein kinase RdoA (MazF antagonist)
VTEGDELLDTAHAALARYDLAPPPEVRPLRLTNNAVFEIRAADGSRFVLRIHRPGYRTGVHIRSELEFLRTVAQELRGSRVDVPKPVGTLGGEPRGAGGWRLGVLDFDDLGLGYYLFDLAPLLGNLADFPESYPRLRRAFLAGYRSIRALPPALEAHLPVLMAARHAVVLTWLAGRRRDGAIDGLPLERHVAYRAAELRRCLTLR